MQEGREGETRYYFFVGVHFNDARSKGMKG